VKKIFGCVMIALALVIVFCGSYAYADCKDKTLRCIKDRGTKSSAGKVSMGQCFYLPLGCDDCKHTHYAKYANECNEQYASECKGNCWACYPADGSSFDGELTCYDTNGKAHNVPS
jgi:hypothetical protein